MRIGWAVFLTVIAPLTIVLLAYDDLRSRAWQTRLARWTLATFFKALALPALVGILLVAWLTRINDRASLRYWWVAGLCVCAAGVAIALTGAWVRAHLAAPPAPDSDADAPDGVSYPARGHTAPSRETTFSSRPPT